MTTLHCTLFISDAFLKDYTIENVYIIYKIQLAIVVTVLHATAEIHSNWAGCRVLMSSPAI
jgi:hypothetical protein